MLHCTPAEVADGAVTMSIVKTLLDRCVLHVQGWRDAGPGQHVKPSAPKALALLARCPAGYLDVDVKATSEAGTLPRAVQV